MSFHVFCCIFRLFVYLLFGVQITRIAIEYASFPRGVHISCLCWTMPFFSRCRPFRLSFQPVRLCFPSPAGQIDIFMGFNCASLSRDHAYSIRTTLSCGLSLFRKRFSSHAVQHRKVQSYSFSRTSRTTWFDSIAVPYMQLISSQITQRQ